MSKFIKKIISGFTWQKQKETLKLTLFRIFSTNKQKERETKKNGYPDHQQKDYALFIYNSKVQDLSDLRGS